MTIAIAIGEYSDTGLKMEVIEYRLNDSFLGKVLESNDTKAFEIGKSYHVNSHWCSFLEINTLHIEIPLIL